MCVVVVIVMELRHFKLNLLYIHILRMKKINNHFLLSFLDRLFLFNSVDEKIQKFQKPFIRPKKLFYYYILDVKKISDVLKNGVALKLHFKIRNWSV